MTINVYVHQDQQGRPDPASFSHEIQTTIDAIRRLWQSFHHLPQLYAVVVNQQWPTSADLVVITERGIGVLELKHYFNEISRKGHVWYAGRIPIHAGGDNRMFRNPHEQVQAYAIHIRDALINSGDIWLPGTREDWADFKMGTGVCFTHPDVILDPFLEEVRQLQYPVTEDWELFSVFRIEDISDWVASLSFESNLKEMDQFFPARLAPEQITELATGFFKSSEWKEILTLMPTGDPYGYLNLIENRSIVKTISLNRDSMSIGRHYDRDIEIPQRFSNASRNHARILRSAEGVYIEDVGSSNGTYIFGKKLWKKWLLKPGQRILIGGDRPGSGVCELEFQLEQKTYIEETSRRPIG